MFYIYPKNPSNIVFSYYYPHKIAFYKNTPDIKTGAFYRGNCIFNLDAGLYVQKLPVSP